LVAWNLLSKQFDINPGVYKMFYTDGGPMAREIEKRQRKLGLLMAGGMAIIGVVMSALLREGGLPPAVAFVALLAIFCAAILATLPWWRLLDHMQRDAQYVSGYWGGSVGAITAFAALFAFSGAESELTRGALLVLVGQAAGFFVFWLGWRLRSGGGER
jgi:ABC-type Fe3+-siderophore transport system permease subunit